MDEYQWEEFERIGQELLNDEIPDEILYGNDVANDPIIQVESLLVSELTVGEDVLDRALFYHLTEHLTDEEICALKERVRSRVEEFYRWEHQDFNFEDIQPEIPEKEQRFIDRGIRSWFRPWTRLAGRMEWECEESFTATDAVFDEAALADICRKYMAMEEYGPYLGKEFMGFISNRCLDYGFDYMKMPDDMRIPECEKIWNEEFPYLVESKEWDICNMAYRFGSPSVMKFQEEACHENGYIGGEVRWSRFLDLREVRTPVIGDEEATGLGQIDYKDCTNVFVILGNDKKAVNLYSLERQQRCVVLESVFWRCRLLMKESEQADKQQETRQERRERLSAKSRLQERRHAESPVSDRQLQEKTYTPKH